MTIGDPLLDLGHMLCTWPRQGVPGVVAMDAPGLPAPDEVIAQYAKHTTRDLGDVKWY